MKKIFFVTTIVALLLSGCATVPPQESFNTYTINGASYISLVSLCNARGLGWEYDTYSGTVTLSKGAHKINLRVGDTMVLVDGVAQHLANPVDMYQGVIVVPYKFKEKVLDGLAYPKTTQPVILPVRLHKVVIDAGHGGTDPGAIGKSGLREKDINLDIAKRLAILMKEKCIAVVLTRSTDTFVSLEARVKKANDSGADLFISVHSNANRVRSLKGFEVYYISPGVSDMRRAQNAAKTMNLGGYRECMLGNSLNLETVLWDMIYTSNRAESIELARAICRKIDCSLNLEVLGIKGANFQVLRGAKMPAVLVEIGFLSNKIEERLLKNNFYRQQLADAIMQGVADYGSSCALAEGSR